VKPAKPARAKVYATKILVISYWTCTIDRAVHIILYQIVVTRRNFSYLGFILSEHFMMLYNVT
jgi:hypothetical protein